VGALLALSLIVVAIVLFSLYRRVAAVGAITTCCESWRC
jgi:hypothetical protein